MRAFLLVALLAMATTVSCQSASCTSSNDALEKNTTISTAQAAITKSGCKKIDEIKFDACPFDEATGIYACACTSTVANTGAWEDAVRSAAGSPCYLGFSIAMSGTLQINSTVSRPIQLIISQNNAFYGAFSNNCTAEDNTNGLKEALKGFAGVVDGVNVKDVTFTTFNATATACALSSSYVDTVKTGTTAPPTAPPTKGPTKTPGGSAASIASSFALVASLIAAVTMLA